MSEWRPFNLNNHVRVKLNARGHEILAKNHLALFGDKAANFPQRRIEEDSEGWSKWQLWELMNEFGSSIYNGCNPPFSLGIEFSTTPI